MPLVAVAASLVALALAAAVAYPRWHRTRLLDEADRLEARGESRRALDISRDVIRANPDDPVAQDVTFRALEGVTEKMAREESAAKALNWFRSEAAEADFESLGDRLGVIEVRVIATAGKTGQISNYEFRDQMIDAIGRYPKSADVPFEAAHASFHQTGGDIAAFGVLPWYALAVERGHAMTQDIWNACVECFAESDPDECADGRTIARDHQHDEALAWARKAIAEGPTGPAYLNAAAILDDFGGGAPSDPFHVALRTLLDKRDVETTRAAILAGSPDQKKLALVLLHDADSQGWGEERDNARKALEDDLSK